MSANHHTPIANGANADDTVFNGPTGQLDQTLTDMLAGAEPFTVLKAGDSGAPDATAALEIESLTKGFLPPRMTSIQRDAISSPAAGLLVHNTTDGVLSRYNGSNWANYGGGNSPYIELIPQTIFSAQSIITMDSIAQDYQDLHLRLKVKQDAGIAGSMQIRFNNASGASDYSWQRTQTGIGSTGRTLGEDTADSEIEIPLPAAGVRYGYVSLWIRNYTLNGVKLFGDFDGIGDSASSKIFFWGAFEWLKAEAITRIDFLRSGNSLSGFYALYALGNV